MALRVSARAMFLVVFLYASSMGCLPIPLFALIGFAIGHLIDARMGALWGGGVGLLIGVAGTALVVRAMRRANRSP
jgi:hypothetical protein